MKKMNKRLKHFADYLEEGRINKYYNMDSKTRDRITATTADIILKEVIYPRIQSNERYLKHCVEFSDEYNETINVLDVLNMFSVWLNGLLKGDDKNDTK